MPLDISVMSVRTMKNPATDTKPPSVTAYTLGSKILVPWDHASNDPHEDAARALAVSMGYFVRRIQRLGDAPRGGAYKVTVSKGDS